MTGQHPGAPAPIASPSSLPASRRTLQLVPTASTRTRRNHGAFTLGGGQLAFVYSARSAGKLYGVSVELGADTLRLAASMTVGQARAMARALLAAAAAVAGTEARAPTSLPARKLAPRAPPKVTALCDSYAGFAPSERTALETAKAILLGRLAKRGALVESTLAAKELARLQLGGLDVECFAVLFIDQQHRVLAFEEMFRGTVAKTAVYPREIARRALPNWRSERNH